MSQSKISRPTWQETYFEIANVIAKRSKDPHTKVGAVLVKDGRVIGLGYNGEPRNFTYKFNWNTSEKYNYVIHAELNAIANATSMGIQINGSDMYLTLSPCHDCMKMLIQYQIKHVYFKKVYDKDFELVQNIAKHSKIKLIKVK